MKQNDLSLRSFWKKYFIATLCVVTAFFLLTVGITALYLRIPHYERYFFLFPWIMVLILSVIIALFSRSSGKDSPLLALAVSGSFSLLCFLIGLFWRYDAGQIAHVSARLVLLIVCSVLISFWFSRKKKTGRSHSKKFRFSK